MSRTTRAVPYKHYWGRTVMEEQAWREECLESPNYSYVGTEIYITHLKRDILLHGTESRNHTYPTHEWFNYANRVARRVARDQLRPHIVLGEDYEFDDSRAVCKYKGVWWDIY